MATTPTSHGLNFYSMRIQFFNARLKVDGLKLGKSVKYNSKLDFNVKSIPKLKSNAKVAKKLVKLQLSVYNQTKKLEFIFYEYTSVKSSKVFKRFCKSSPGSLFI